MDAVRGKLEAMFLDFLHALQRRQIVDLRILCPQQPDIMMDEDGDKRVTTKLCRLMDSRTTKRYIQMFAVAVLVLELVIKSKSISQRDVYYTLKYLFKDQRESNIVIQELGALLRLRRHEMNVIPISKGRIFGNIKFRFNNETEWCNCDQQMSNGEISERISHLWISSDPANIHTIVSSNVKAVIIIEKEGIFRRLCEDNFTTYKLSSILITGCGFPDIATRALVSVLAGKYPMIPIYGVCDYNPYGVALLSTFMFPSKSNALETTGLEVKLRWLMLRNRHINEYQIAYGDSQNELAVLMPLTHVDIRMIRSLQANPKLPTSFKEELSLMHSREQKMELEALFSFGLHVVSNAIQEFIETNDYI